MELRLRTDNDYLFMKIYNEDLITSLIAMLSDTNFFTVKTEKLTQDRGMGNVYTCIQDCKLPYGRTSWFSEPEKYFDIMMFTGYYAVLLK